MNRIKRNNNFRKNYRNPPCSDKNTNKKKVNLYKKSPADMSKRKRPHCLTASLPAPLRAGARYSVWCAVASSAAPVDAHSGRDLLAQKWSRRHCPHAARLCNDEQENAAEDRSVVCSSHACPAASPTPPWRYRAHDLFDNTLLSLILRAQPPCSRSSAAAEGGMREQPATSSRLPFRAERV
jgi:hypothetical protein